MTKHSKKEQWRHCSTRSPLLPARFFAADLCGVEPSGSRRHECIQCGCRAPE